MNIEARLEQAQEIYQLQQARGLYDGNHSVEHYLMKIIGSLAEADKAYEQGKDVNKIPIGSEYKNEQFTRKECYLNYSKATKEFPSFRAGLFELYILGTQQDKLADVYIGLMFLIEGLQIQGKFCIECDKKEYEDENRIPYSGYLSWGYDDFSFTEKAYAISDLIHSIRNLYSEGTNADNILAYELYSKAIQLGDLFAFDLDWHVAEKMKYLQAVKS